MGKIMGENFGRRAFLKASGALLLASALPAIAGSDKPLQFNEVLRLLKIGSPYGAQVFAAEPQRARTYKTKGGEITYPGFDPSVFLRGKSSDSLLAAVNTMVHETMHYVCQALARDKDPNCLFEQESMMAVPDTRVRILVRGQRTFPSVEMVDFFTGRFQRAPRFDTYIDTQSKSLGTQSSGVYGLLDEYNAYYAGTRAANDLLKYFLRLPIAKGSEMLWIIRMADVSASLTAFPEFRGYIGGYLAFAKQNHPDVYRQVTGNKGFVKAFSAVSASFQALANEYTSKLDDRLDYLKKKGLNITTIDDGLTAQRAGRGLQLESYRKLQKALAEDKRIQAELVKLKA